jgi:hypothetical protein
VERVAARGFGLRFGNRPERGLVSMRAVPEQVRMRLRSVAVRLEDVGEFIRVGRFESPALVRGCFGH